LETPNSPPSYEEFLKGIASRDIRFRIVPNIPLKIGDQLISVKEINKTAIRVSLMIVAQISVFPILSFVWKKWDLMLGLGIEAIIFLIYYKIFKYIKNNVLVCYLIHFSLFSLALISYIYIGLKNPFTVCFLLLLLLSIYSYIMNTVHNRWLKRIVIQNKVTYEDAILNNKIIIY